MAATATTTETTETTETTYGATSASMASTEGFDELFVQPVDTRSHGGSLPALPAGWQHAILVERIARQPRERRETILAGLFALVAGLWAPLGVVAFLARNALLFFGLTAVVAVLGAAPRPAAASQAVTGRAHRIRPAVERVGPALAAAWGRLRPLASRAGEAGRRVLVALRGGGHDLLERAEPVRDWLRSADRRVAAAVRDWLDDLSSGGGDHSRPSSAR